MEYDKTKIITAICNVFSNDQIYKLTDYLQSEKKENIECNKEEQDNKHNQEIKDNKNNVNPDDDEDHIHKFIVDRIVH